MAAHHNSAPQMAFVAVPLPQPWVHFAPRARSELREWAAAPRVRMLHAAMSVAPGRVFPKLAPEPLVRATLRAPVALAAAACAARRALEQRVRRARRQAACVPFVRVPAPTLQRAACANCSRSTVRRVQCRATAYMALVRLVFAAACSPGPRAAPAMPRVRVLRVRHRL